MTDECECRYRSLEPEPSTQTLLDDIARTVTEEEYDLLLGELQVIAAESGVGFVAVQIVYYLAWATEIPTAVLVVRAFYDVPVTPNQAALALLPFANSCQPRVAETIGELMTQFPE